MAGYGYGQGPPGGYGQPGYGAPPHGQPGYGAPGGYGQPGYGAPPGQGMIPPGVDPQVYQWFIAVDADRSGKISAIELQQALTNTNWSHFNPEVCRLMIGMFDRDQSGTIDLLEFQSLWTYIQQWRGVFQQYDRDRSGAIEGAELHTALSQMGYNLSPNFINLVVCKFDVQARRQLTLDNFIQACVMLRSITETFRQKDTGGMGTIQISYEDFMTMAMLNKP
ncbi:peflin-like [Liolophura sinensis]|uniref:peflin-like n=1 Tax=Liolophura sinensis TaxID=3198878 RepID=UPI0031583300